MTTQPPRPVLLILGTLPLLVLLSWPGAGASTAFQLCVGTVVAALFFAAYPRAHRAWPACTLGMAGAAYYFLVVDAQAGSRGRIAGAILAVLLVLAAVGPAIYGSVRDSLMAGREARTHSAEVLTRLRREEARRHAKASLAIRPTDMN